METVVRWFMDRDRCLYRLLAIMVKFCFSLFALLVLSALPVLANEGAPEKALVQNVLFKRFLCSDGLPDERIRSIFQDKKGFLWVGTMNGVCRYDGLGFKNFSRSANGTGIAGNWAYTITEDDKNNIWIGTNEGFSRFDIGTETFENFKLPIEKTNLYSNRVNALFFETDGKLWIGGKSGLWRFDTESKRFFKPDGPLFKLNATKIKPSAAGGFWAALDDGVVRFDTKTNKFDFFRLSVSPNPYGDRIWNLLEEKEGLYVATAAAGLAFLPFSKGKPMGEFVYLNKYATKGTGLENTQVFDIKKSPDGVLWLGTDRGLAKIEKPTTSGAVLDFYANIAVNTKSISSDRVYTLYVDRADVLWCGTEAGLNSLYLPSLSFRYFCFANSAAVDQVRAIHADGFGRVLLGTYKSGAFETHIGLGGKSTGIFQKDLPSENGVRSILSLGKEEWIGTLDGVFVMERKDFKRKLLSGHAVFCLLKDRNGNVWAGTNKGLFKISSNGTLIGFQKEFDALKNLASSFVRSLFEDAVGNIWVGLENGGAVLVPVDGSPFRMFQVNPIAGSDGIAGNTVYAIAECPNGTYWIGTESGLSRMMVEKNDFGKVSYKNFTVQNGLPDKSVNAILTDDLGRLWISSIKGLARFDPRKEIFRNYLPDFYFNHSAAFKSKDGQLFFGTSDGFIVFDPQRIQEDIKPANVLVSGIKLFNKSVGIGEEMNGQVVLEKSILQASGLVLGYKNNVLTLDFSAFHFAYPLHNRFVYKMVGFDKDWIQALPLASSATYTNLDPGTYRFLLKGANYLGVWDQHCVELSIKVLPPPWRTWWAMTFYILLFGILLYITYKYALVQLRQRQLLGYEQMEKRQLKKLDAMKTQFFTDISHEFRTPLSLIVGPAEELMATKELDTPSRHKAQLIRKNSKKLLYLIDELMTFQKLDEGKLLLRPQTLEINLFLKAVHQNFSHLAAQKQVDFALSLPQGQVWASVDPGKLEMVLNNLLFNAFKYVPTEGHIFLSAEKCSRAQVEGAPEAQASDWLKIAVEDNGKGIRAEDVDHLFERYFQSHNALKGSGLGLSLTKSLVELHGGTIHAKSLPGVKTTFYFFLPLLTEAVAKEQALPVETPFAFDYEVDDLIEDNVLDEDEHIKTAEGKNTLLLVDDNVEVLDYLELVFQKQFNIVRAMNGSEALAAIKESELPVDLVISDVMMPLMDGIGLCKYLKSDLETSHIPVVLLTAKTTTANTLQGLKAGADDYVAKPFYPEVLKSKVANLLNAKRRIIEKFTESGANVANVPKNISLNPLDEEFLKNVIEAINANLDNDEFSVEELGSKVAMSRSNLFRKLKALTGQTPVEFIYAMRMNKAVELLLERRLSVSQISYEVGFKSPSSFTKSFKKQFGKSPTEYLHEILGAQPKS